MSQIAGPPDIARYRSDAITMPPTKTCAVMTAKLTFVAFRPTRHHPCHQDHRPGVWTLSSGHVPRRRPASEECMQAAADVWYARRVLILPVVLYRWHVSTCIDVYYVCSCVVICGTDHRVYTMVAVASMAVVVAVVWVALCVHASCLHLDPVHGSITYRCSLCVSFRAREPLNRTHTFMVC